uniref:large ribosomal subunit protein mL38 n=1 Tax=Myxine glutinosa TaxID=7769 RepID=UPI00358FA6CB
MAALVVRGTWRPLTHALWTGGSNRSLGVSACFQIRRRPLGPMPNEEFEGKDPSTLPVYHSFEGYLSRANEERERRHWWHSFRDFLPTDLVPGGGAEELDIGLPVDLVSRKMQLKARNTIKKANKENAELQRAHRLCRLEFDMDKLEADYEQTCGQHHIKRIATYYGVYRDLFAGAVFVPRVPMHVNYVPLDDVATPVYRGNVVMPGEAQNAPEVIYDAEDGSLWSLLLTNPDGHLSENEAEYLHWFVGNIPGSRLVDGDTICPYLPPIPPQGTGYHRWIFVLYKQERHVDFFSENRPDPCNDLLHRTFRTIEFYRQFQDVLTPAGLAFCQTKWDESVRQTFHSTLNLLEPVYEYIWPEVYHPKEVKFPHRKPLRYLDRYRTSHEPSYGSY